MGTDETYSVEKPKNPVVHDDVINEEEEHYYYIEPSPRMRICRAIFAVALFLMLGWFVGSVALSALSLAFDSNPPLSVMVEGTHVKLGHEQVIVAEMIPDELQVFVVNMTEGAEIPEDMTVAFYSCLRTISPNIVGCVSQYTVPTFEECLALSTEETEAFDLSQPRAMATCGVATLSKGEFSLCSIEEPVFLSVWNLEDKQRTVEMTFSYSEFSRLIFSSQKLTLALDECQNCAEIEGVCPDFAMYWECVLFFYMIMFFACCCCVGCVCGCTSGNKQEYEEAFEDDTY